MLSFDKMMLPLDYFLSLMMMPFIDIDFSSCHYFDAMLICLNTPRCRRHCLFDDADTMPCCGRHWVNARAGPSMSNNIILMMLMLMLMIFFILFRCCHFATLSFMPLMFDCLIFAAYAIAMIFIEDDFWWWWLLFSLMMIRHYAIISLFADDDADDLFDFRRRRWVSRRPPAMMPPAPFALMMPFSLMMMLMPIFHYYAAFIIDDDAWCWHYFDDAIFIISPLAIITLMMALIID